MPFDDMDADNLEVSVDLRPFIQAHFLGGTTGNKCHELETTVDFNTTEGTGKYRPGYLTGQ